MAEFEATTETALARARVDPAFRHGLLAGNLEALLASMNRLKRKSQLTDPTALRQLREGAELAVKLADLIARGSRR